MRESSAVRSSPLQPRLARATGTQALRAEPKEAARARMKGLMTKNQATMKPLRVAGDVEDSGIAAYRNPKASIADGNGIASSGGTSSQATRATTNTTARGQFSRSELWVTDSSASDRVTYSRNTMYDFEIVTELVELAEETMSTPGWGKSHLKLVFGTGEEVLFRLNDVPFFATFRKHFFCLQSAARCYYRPEITKSETGFRNERMVLPKCGRIDAANGYQLPSVV